MAELTGRTLIRRAGRISGSGPAIGFNESAPIDPILKKCI